MRKITKKDFIENVERFSNIFEKVCGPASRHIELYARIPTFTSFLGTDEEMKRQREQNEKGMQILSKLDELPDNFSSIPYVRVTLVPKDETRAPRSSRGWITFGKLLPRHILFQAQPEEVTQRMESDLFPQNKAPRGFRLGDGFEKNYNPPIPPSVIANPT